MTNDQVRRNVIRSTVSGYVRMAVRLGIGLVTFRLLYQQLTPEEFGFWSLLWAIFGYGVLLDFGFGYAAQKRVAELSVRRDWARLSEALSTILCFQLLGAVIVAAFCIAFSGPLIDLFKVSAANRELFRRVLEVFLVGTAVAFPMALFTSILEGQQRMTTSNNVAIGSILGNLVAVLAFAWLKFSFLTLISLTLTCIFAFDVLAAWLALRHMPEVRLRPSLVSRGAFVETTRFSVYAYLNLLSTALRNKMDQPVIGSVLGVAAVTPYQPGGKLGEMFGLLTRQIADVLSPTAAHLHARGDQAGLRRILIDGLRFSILAATPLYLATAFYMAEILRLLTGLRRPTTEMLWSAELLLLWYYSLTITHWVFKRIFLMAGQERRLMRQGVAEAAINVVLSIVLTVAFRSILGVAIGSLVPSLIFGWGLLWGWAAREAGMTRGALFQRVVGPAWKGCLPMIAVAGILRFQPWWTSGASTLLFALEGALVLLVGVAGLWQFSLTASERTTLVRRLAEGIRRPPLDPART